MIRLPNTGTYSLELITAQNGAQSVVSYSDATSSAYTGGTQVASITSATTTTICSTPAASTVRDVDQINIKNTYAGSHTVTVQVDANGTNYPLIVAALLTDESLNYTHGSGWRCLDANGNIKNTALTAMTSAQLAAIISDETGSGAAVFANGPTLIAPILGTPASGTVTNLTGTASININGTVGATTPAAGTFTTLTSTGNATLGDAEATDTHAIKGATTLLANSASAALTITQTGAGNAFVVEDSASTDATPFVIDSAGLVWQGGTTAPAVSIAAFNPLGCVVSSDTTNGMNAILRKSCAATSPAVLGFFKSRGTVASPSVITTGDNLALINAHGFDGTNYAPSAQIICGSEGTISTGVVPGNIRLNTYDSSGVSREAMQISSAQTVTLGGTSTAPALKVNPDPTANTRWVTITGSNGGNPTIGTSGGSLRLQGANDIIQCYAAGTGTSTLTWGNVTTGSLIGISALNSGATQYINTLNNHHTFYSSNGASTLLRVAPSSVTDDRYITITGANAGNPMLSASAGSLNLNRGLMHPVATNTAATLTIDDTHYQIIQTTTASTYTLPTASSYTGRVLKIVTQFAGTVISASSNVVPIAGGAAGTAILAATAGKFATLVSNGTNWVITEAN